MSIVKPAATLMLCRDHEDALQVLLLRRNKALKFAAGFWVFPGGKIEAEEISRCENDLDAAKMAAVRETREETQIQVDTKDLIFFRHWTTPTAEPRRYATWFFFGEVPAYAPEVQVDDSEIKEHLWIHPQRALEKYKTGELVLMPPTLFSLQLIRKCQTLEEAKAIIAAQEPIFVLPVMVPQGKKMIILYEGDAGYEQEKADMPGPRHRWIMDFKNKTSTFEYRGCEEVLPANGGDDFF